MVDTKDIAHYISNFNASKVNVITKEIVFDNGGLQIEKFYIDKPIYVHTTFDYTDNKYMIYKVTKTRVSRGYYDSDSKIYSTNCFYIARLTGKFINSFCSDSDFRPANCYDGGLLYDNTVEITKRIINSNETLKKSIGFYFYNYYRFPDSDEYLYGCDFFSHDDLKEIVKLTSKEQKLVDDKSKFELFNTLFKPTLDKLASEHDMIVREYRNKYFLTFNQKFIDDLNKKVKETVENEVGKVLDEIGVEYKIPDFKFTTNDFTAIDEIKMK